MLRFATFVFVSLSFLLAHPLHAQEAGEGSGRVFLTDWPHRFIGTDLLPQQDADSLFRSELVPFMDSLIVNYRYRIEEDRPHVGVSIAWVPGEFGILDGERMPFSDFPGDVRLMGVELLADVTVDGMAAAQLLIGADSMMLAPVEQAYEFDGYGLTFDNVFVNVPDRDARRIFERGFALRNLRIVSISFESFESDEAEVQQQRRRRIIEIHRRHPQRRTIFIPRVWIDIGWHIGPRRYVPPRAASGSPRGEAVTRGENPADDAWTGRTRTRTGSGTTSGTDSGRGTGSSAEPRGRGTDTSTGARGTDTSTGARGRGTETPSQTRGRGTSTRGSNQSDEGKSSTTRTRTKKDDDDDSWIESGALAAVAAVGAFAVLGGSVGYYGNLSETPLGLSAGYISPQGGFLLQTGVNEAMIGGTGDEPRRAMLKGTAFYNLFDAPLMPAVGAGVIGTEDGSDVLLDPVFSLGAALNLNEFLLYGGYDLANRSIELGFSVNIRQIILNNRRRAGG